MSDQNPATLPDRLRDFGPRYKETPADPYAPDAPSVAEPFNAVTAAFFVLLVGVWAWRLRGRYRRFPFLMSCLPVLLAGGVGGTLYHALRTSPVYFLLDLIPILLLGLAGAVYLTVRLGRRYGAARVALIAAGVIAVTAFVNGGLRLLPNALGTLQVNLSYATQAVLILIPLGVTLARTRFRYAGYVFAGVGCFAVAWFCRLVDLSHLNPLPMGSHWLWHTFGAACTQFVIEYFYRVERDANAPLTRVAVEPPPRSPA
jgi:hypothetical protein